MKEAQKILPRSLEEVMGMDLRNPSSNMRVAMDTAIVTETTMLMTQRLNLSKGKTIHFKFERVTSN